jgi:hypothetical protein
MPRFERVPPPAGTTRRHAAEAESQGKAESILLGKFLLARSAQFAPFDG